MRRLYSLRADSATGLALGGRNLVAEKATFQLQLRGARAYKRNSTFCPQCGERIMHRQHFAVASLEVVDGKCRFCGHPIAGIWEP